jgi:hypothetical protein
VTGRVREIKPITRAATLPFLIDIHYAARTPSISKAFGVFYGDELEGVVTYGTPASSTLRVGLAGAELASNVLELNRLCLRANYKNDASWLVSHSLKMLGGNFIVVSFSDTSQDHVGTVYQASNFLYTGLSAKRTDWVVKGKEHLHGQTVADEFRGKPNRANLMREKYGDDFRLSPRSRKHRYVRIVGSRGFIRIAMSSLKYNLQPYPKKEKTK